MPLLLPLVFACRAGEPPPPAPAAAPLESRLHLADPADARLFAALRQTAETAIPGWRTLPFRRLGNFVEGRWCSPGVNPAACEGGSVVHDLAPGTAWRQLATLTYDPTWPECAGVVWSAGNLPETGWGATVWFSVRGAGVVGEGFGASFVMSSPEARTLRVGDWSVELGSKTLSLRSPGAMAEARSLVQGPENFSATVRLRYEALVAMVRIAAKEGAITVWQEGPYLGGGLPPERTEVPAPKAEAERLAQEAEAQLAADRDLLVLEAATLQPLLAGLLPPAALR